MSQVDTRKFLTCQKKSCSGRQTSSQMVGLMIGYRSSKDLVAIEELIGKRSCGDRVGSGNTFIYQLLLDHPDLYPTNARLIPDRFMFCAQ